MTNPSLSANDAAPISTSTRFDILDALRGFALFGIFFANVPFFAGWLFLDANAKSGIARANIYDAFMLMMIEGRFYTIFSSLFFSALALHCSYRACETRLTKQITFICVASVYCYLLA